MKVATTQRAGDDMLLAGMVELVRETYAATMPLDEGGGLARLEQALHQRGILQASGSTTLGSQSWSSGKPGRRGFFARPLFGALVAAAATAVLVVGGAVIYRHLDKVTYEVMNGGIGPGGFVRPTAPGAAIVFSEGSEISLTESARTRVDSLTADGGRLVIESGSVRARIVPRRRARWFVEAGPYTIRVTGTEFNVKWSWADESLDIEMDRGSVVVTGPGAPGGLTLTAGMRLVANRGAALAITGGAEERAAADDRLVEPPPAVEPPAVNVERVGPSVRATKAGPVARSDRRVMIGASASGEPWERQLARGNVEGILADAEARGVDRVLASASGRELSALADAARYGHRPGLARRVLLVMRDRFPRTVESREAAFFLGALAEDGGVPANNDRRDRVGGGGGWTSALGWYERYLEESRHGRYAAQALGRRMVMTHKMKGSEAAQPLASEYLDRFPGGPYASAARQLIRSP